MRRQQRADVFAGADPGATLQALHGLVSCAEWTGVPLSTLLDEAGVDPKAKWMLAEGADSLAMSRSVPLKKGLRRRDGRALPERRAHHARQRLSDAAAAARLGRQHEREVPAPAQNRRSAGHDLSTSRSNYSPLLPDGKAYKFYFVNEVKSFITQPSFGYAMKGPGFYEISGIAYSGTGRIEKVLVSADGGKSWGEAAVQGPVSPRAFTRFSMPWRWDGQPATLTSRAWDDSGAVQPLRADFVAVRGEAKKVPNVLGFPNQHYNSLTAWGIHEHRGDQACLCLSRTQSPSSPRSPSPLERRSPPIRPHLGKPVGEADIKAWDISVLPDGSNLPPGSGTPAEGAKLYVDKGCNQCHGDNGKGGPSNVLVGNPSLTADGITSNKTIANFWAYPTTLFDYIRRAMPWPTPHTLTDNEVYAICAYLFAANNLIPQDQAMNAQTLPKVKMPNHDNFIIKFPDRI